MANWQRTLDIYDAFQACDETPQGIRDLSKLIAEKLKELPPFTRSDINDEKRDIIEAFEDMLTWPDDQVTTEAFNTLMDELYDWGDQPVGAGGLGTAKVCWIAATIPTIKPHADQPA